MATVIANEQLSPDIYQLRVAGDFQGRPGQFYMLRCWDSYPLLSRPISIHDIGDGFIVFLFRVHGTGTRLLSELKPQQELQLEGPFGNGFPVPEGRTALVGGGIGIAPLLLAAKSFPSSDVYLGYTGKPFAAEAFKALPANVTVVSGGSVLDALNTHNYDTIYACGPTAMMTNLALKTSDSSVRLYISVEKHMACGIGACNGCNVSMKDGNRKACTDGPVFLAEEVKLDDLHEL